MTTSRQVRGELRLFMGKARLEIFTYASKKSRRKKLEEWQHKYGDTDDAWTRDFYVTIIPHKYPTQKSDEEFCSLEN